MGIWYSLHPFDEEKFYETVVPSLKNGLEDRSSLWEKYKRTRIGGKSDLTPERIADIAGRFDDAFKVYPGFSAQTAELAAFEQANPWFYEWTKLFEFVIFHECAYYQPEFYCGDQGLASAFGDTEAATIFSDLSVETVFTYHSMGVVNWTSNEDVKLIIRSLSKIPEPEYAKENNTLDFHDFLLLADRNGLGLVYGADLSQYEMPVKVLS